MSPGWPVRQSPSALLTGSGGDGADVFVPAGGDSSPASGQHDRISGFVQGVDHIDLTGIDAISSTQALDAFHFIGAAALDGTAGALNYYYDGARGVTVVVDDTNGDRVAALPSTSPAISH